MRLFVGIDIPTEIRERLARFLSEMKALAPGARWVGVDTFHITLKFIGERSPHDMEEIKHALAGIKSQPTTVTFRGTGFFPDVKRPRAFWVGVEHDAHLPQLTRQVDEVLARLGVEREKKPYTPHLTLARGGDSRRPHEGGRMQARPGGTLFSPIQERLTGKTPEFGSMTASEFFLYESKLSPQGAHYTKIAQYPLSGPA